MIRNCSTASRKRPGFRGVFLWVSKLAECCGEATAEGTIETAGWAGDYGNMILVKHGYGMSTRYGHLSRIVVNAGSTVHRGQIIGYVGATGRTTGSHLHYEIMMNGSRINPLNLLSTR